MGSRVSSAFLLTSLLALLFGCSSVLAQTLRQRDALCNTDGCFVVYFQPKTFLESWRACKEKGGDLATIKRKVDAAAIAILFSTVDLRHSRTTVQVWIGLQRQPRQCNATRPLRGFSWTIGDQDTEYTDWQNPDSADSCSVPRCVFMGYSTEDQDHNFKWIDSACAVSADGYLCHYAYAGMCPPLWSEGEGNVTYTTPFNLLSALLTHVPVGSVATCINDPCEHACENTPGSHICHCHLGYSLIPGTCEQMCVNYEGGFECYCSEGFELMSDNYSCEKREEADDQYAVTPPSLWVTGQAGPLWDYGWNPEQRHTDWPTQEEESLDWLTESTRVLNSDVIWATSPPLVLDPLTQGTDKDEEEAVDRADWSNGDQRFQTELKVLSATSQRTRTRSRPSQSQGPRTGPQEGQPPPSITMFQRSHGSARPRPSHAHTQTSAHTPRLFTNCTGECFFFLL
uniref:CD248 molecule, endosialin a n=1 Tax=Haplochromis burtoni TaxID=8153 RepID=A0A3Q2VWA6_HAPBU